MSSARERARFARVASRILLAAALLAGSQAAGQDAPRQDSGGRGWFGAPVLKGTVIRDQAALMAGGRGGWYLSPSWMIGGGLYGTVSEVDAPAVSLPGTTGPLDVKLDTFGVDLEYVPRPAARTHLTLGVFLGGCAVRFAKDGSDEQQDETDFAFLLEPSLGMEVGITAWLRLHLALSYRLVGGVDQPGLGDRDFFGPAAALALKLGRFP